MRKRGRQFWEQTVADFQRSAQTQRTFCEQHGIKLSTLQYWIYRLQRESEQAKPDQRTRKESQLQHRLHLSQKMEAINKLASALANDFNNILTAIMGLTSVIMDDIQPSETLMSDFNDILAACRKGHDLTRNLQAFAGDVRLRLENVSLNDLVLEVNSLLVKILPGQITLKTRLDPRLPLISGDAGLLTHALIGLATNAAEAISSRGTLTFRTESVVAGLEGEPPLSPRRARGPCVRLVVEDTGEGMDADTLEHAMEPFFSTKPKEQGVGLGLSMVYHTIRSHGGSMVIDSAPREGTTVTILLPALSGDALETASPDQEPRQARLDAGTVLLVDDEELVLSAGKRLLSRLGCEVLVAATATDALRIYRENRAEVACAIIDLKMPQMSGIELYRELKSINPGIKVIFSSGQIMGNLIEELKTLGPANFIQKPYDFSRLREMMIRVLES